MSDEPSLHDDAILKGRLALALVSERAAKCRNKACARKRQCLARMGEDFARSKPMGDCPNMTETEWRMVGFGMACMRIRLSGWLRAADDAEFAREAALPPHERRRAQAARAKETEAEQPRERPAFPYATFLWLDMSIKKREIAATGRELFAVAASCGCRCAAERRMNAECIRGTCGFWEAAKMRIAAERAGVG